MVNETASQRILITGGAGFIGANLTRYLLEHEAGDITVYDNLSSCGKANLDRAISDSQRQGRVEFVEGDVLDFDTLLDSLAGHDVVVHLAAQTRVRESIVRPQPHIEENSKGTLNVIEAARRQSVEKFVFASSNAAVGEQIPPVNESMVARPLSPYGAIKLYGEALCSAYYASFGLKTVALRFANAYGSYSEHKTSVVSKFIRLAREGQDIEIYGDGKQTRDFIHARDIARAIYLVIALNESDASSPWGEIFQIATGEETSIIDLAGMIREAANSESDSIRFTDSIKGEIRRNFSDISKVKRLLGFEPQVKLPEGLSGTCNQSMMK